MPKTETFYSPIKTHLLLEDIEVLYNYSIFLSLDFQIHKLHVSSDIFMDLPLALFTVFYMINQLLKQVLMVFMQIYNILCP